MRPIAILLSGLLMLGCIQDSGGTHEDFTDAQLKPFMDAGCTRSWLFDLKLFVAILRDPSVAESVHGTYLNCANATFATEFGCEWGLDGVTAMTHHGAGLDPQVPMVECVDYNARGPSASYVFCRSYPAFATRWDCTSYVAFEDGKFVRMTNSNELARRIAPITSEEEALDFVLLSEGAIETIKRPELDDLRASAERREGGFMVKVFHIWHDTCPFQDVYYEYTYDVSVDGKIKLINPNIVTNNLTVVYTRVINESSCIMY